MSEEHGAGEVLLRTGVIVPIGTDGTGTLETSGRGKAALRWIARLKGEKPLRALD
jgi:hypothetical protein